jgi:hypothetical protein
MIILSIISSSALFFGIVILIFIFRKEICKKVKIPFLCSQNTSSQNTSKASGDSSAATGTGTGESGTATGTSYNIFSSDNTAAGALAEWKVQKGFGVNIVAVHERDWPNYKYKNVTITYQGKSANFVVGDYCADKDCNKCCTKNAAEFGKPKPFLLDMDSRAVTKTWGIKKPEESFKKAVQYKFGALVNAKTEWTKLGAKWDG